MIKRNIYTATRFTEIMIKTNTNKNNNFRNDVIMPTTRRIKNIQPVLYELYCIIGGTVVTVNHTAASYLNRRGGGGGINLISGLPRRA